MITTNCSTTYTNYNNTLQAIADCIKKCGEHPMTADELAVEIMNIIYANGYRHVDNDQMVIDISEYYRLLNQRLTIDPWSPNVVYCNGTGEVTTQWNDETYTSKLTLSNTAQENIVAK